MNTLKKIFATVLATAIAASTISLPAFAHDPQNYKGPGILPLVGGPIAAAAIAGPVTSTTTWYTTQFAGWQFKGWKWIKVYKHHHYKWVKVPKFKPKFKQVKHSKSHKSINGKAVVGCIIGSAAGAITASIRKATAMGNPPRWRSQAEHEKIVASGYEKQFELTNDEAQTAVALCGLGSFALHWPQSAPVVKAKY